MKKNILYFIVMAALLAVFFVPGVRNFVTNTFFPVATIDKAVTLNDADYDIELKGINTADTNLKNFKGKKLVFLNFWGTWCPPCRQEWPSIQKLYEAKNGKIDFVLIAMQDKEEDVRQFLKENNYTVPVYMAKSPITENVLPKVFPTTFLLNQTGRIIIKEDGTRDWNSDNVHGIIDNVSK